MHILVINSGSSSIKFAVYELDSFILQIEGFVECIGFDTSAIIWKKSGSRFEKTLKVNNHEDGLSSIIDLLKECDLAYNIKGIGHRVVHGGKFFSESTVVDERVIKLIEACIPLAPLHNPHNIAGILACQKIFVGIPNVVVFDTAFASTMPIEAKNYAIPRKIRDEYAIQRYGFHGTSHRYVSTEARRILSESGRKNGRLITLHLGNGCSASAILDGKCVDTTMGFTPLEGLMMGTRSGDIDPSIFSYLNEQHDMSVQDVYEMLNKDCGLLGVSGKSSDMRQLKSLAADGHVDSAIAIDMFVYRLCQKIAALTVALGGLDALVFTGGIGENDTDLRRKTIAKLPFLDVDIDSARNQAQQIFLSSEDKETAVMIVPTNEEKAIALETSEKI
ncbi:MAG: acetate kinase [Lentisphaeria bacterium]|nr:acetate kinase [Lentisphaeria bacterium]